MHRKAKRFFLKSCGTYKATHRIGQRHHAARAVVGRRPLVAIDDEPVSSDFRYIDDEILVNTQHIPEVLILNMTKKCAPPPKKARSAAKPGAEGKSLKAKSCAQSKSKAGGTSGKKARVEKVPRKQQKVVQILKKAKERVSKTSSSSPTTRSAMQKREEKRWQNAQKKKSCERKPTAKNIPPAAARKAAERKTAERGVSHKKPPQKKPPKEPPEKAARPGKAAVVVQARKRKRRMASLNAEAMVIAMYEDVTPPKRAKCDGDAAACRHASPAVPPRAEDAGVATRTQRGGGGVSKKVCAAARGKSSSSLSTAPAVKPPADGKSADRSPCRPTAKAPIALARKVKGQGHAAGKDSKKRAAAAGKAIKSKAVARPCIDAARKKLKNAQKKTKSAATRTTRDSREAPAAPETEPLIDARLCKRMASLNAMAILAASAVKPEKRKQTPKPPAPPVAAATTTTTTTRPADAADAPVIVETTPPRVPKVETQEVVDLTETPTPSSSSSASSAVGAWTPDTKHTLGSPYAALDAPRPPRDLAAAAAAGEAGVKIEYAAARSAVIGGYVAAGGSAMFPPMCRCDACAYASRINPLLLHRGAYGSAFSAVPPHHHAYGAPPGVPFPHDEYSCFYQPAGPMIQTFTDTCVLPKPVAMRIPQSDKTELQAPPAVHAGHRRAAFISAAADLYSGKRRAEGCEIVLKRERRERGNPGGAEKEGEDCEIVLKRERRERGNPGGAEKEGEDCEIVLKKERRERGNPGGAEKEEEDCEIVLKRERRERGNPGGAEKEEEGCEIVLKRERRDRGSLGGTEEEEERRSLAIEERLDIKEEPHPLPAVHGLCKTVGSSGSGGGAPYLGCKLPGRSSAEGRARDGGSSDTRARDGGSCETRARDGGSSETRARDGGSSDERRRDGRSGSTREGDETSDKDRDAREGPRRRKVFPGRNDVHGRAIEPRCKNGNDDAHRKLTADDDDKRTLVASAHAAAVVADNKRTLVVSASSAPCLPLPMVVQVDKTGRVSAELRQGGKSAGQSSACRRGGARPANPASTEKRMKGCSKSDWPANPSAEKRGKSRQLCAAGRATARPAAGSGSRSGSRSPPRSKTRKSPCETACVGGGGATCKPDAGGRGSRAATEGAAKSRSTTPSGVKRSKVDGTRADADQRALVRQVGKQRLHQTNGSSGGGGNERKSVSPAVTKGGERRPRTDGGGGERSRTHAPDAQDAKRGGGVGRRKLSVGWEFDGPSAEKPVYHQNDAPTRLRQCYEAIRHEEGDVIRVRDCVLLRSGFRKKDLPFVAKISAFYENPDDGEIMMGLLWYYRPEHTELTNLPTCVAAELFASKHQDENNVACIEDKCYVLTPHEYARYCKEQRIKGERHRWRDLAIVPASEDPFLRRDRQPVPTTHPDLVFVCRRVYDFRQKRLLKNPFK